MITNSEFINQLTFLKKKQFTGKIIVKSNKNWEWNIYLTMGRLVWADGGAHANRSWRRHLVKYCPQIDLNNLGLRDVDKFDCQNHHTLSILLQRNLVNREQLTAFIENKISEILFDILQLENQEFLSCFHEEADNNSLGLYGIKTPISLINIEEIIETLQVNWSTWTDKGLTNISPNLAPNLANPWRLKQRVSDLVYQNFVRLINGKRSLRDLALKMNKDVLPVTFSLLPYFQENIIELMEVPDIILPAGILSTTTIMEKKIETIKQEKSLIIAIDDSQQMLKIMEKIVQNTQHEFIGISDALQALPILISRNPSLVFLDIHMPIINGYEICQQIRRVSKLKQTPIVIVTSNDGIVDRVKAKITGATDFLSKPINVDKVLQAIDKYITDQPESVMKDPYNSDTKLNLA